MKITFIYPNFADFRSKDAMQPLVFGILSALTPPDMERRLMDERVEKIDFSEPTDLAAISVQTFTAKRAYNIAAQFRSRGVKVVLGGFHPTLVPEEAACHADALVLGEAETTWPRLLADLRIGKLQPRYTPLPVSEASGDIIPDRTIFQGKKYSPLVPVRFGYGCHNNCTFCSVHAFYGNKIHQRPVDKMIKEIRALKNRLLIFVDDNLTSNYPAARELFKALKPLKKKWVCQLSLDAARDEELIASMAASGCLTVFIGFESLNPASLQSMNKQQNLKYHDYTQIVRKFKKHGIMVVGSFVFGCDQDTKEVFEQTLRFALQARLCLAHFNPLFPTPGTALYANLATEKRLLYEKWWLAEDYSYGSLQFRPLHMTPQFVTEQCRNLRQSFNTWGSIGRRALDFRANARNPFQLGAYLLANIISRQEISAKQGIKLG